mmetsp:Transcript_22513/g.50719  ORF Transcript_22513/g.50719 Transcript_22513/m.50719 type:complete len:269 (+) Transcript_22513:310-1116(+)
MVAAFDPLDAIVRFLGDPLAILGPQDPVRPGGYSLLLRGVVVVAAGVKFVGGRERYFPLGKIGPQGGDPLLQVGLFPLLVGFGAAQRAAFQLALQLVQSQQSLQILTGQHGISLVSADVHPKIQVPEKEGPVKIRVQFPRLAPPKRSIALNPLHRVVPVPPLFPVGREVAVRKQQGGFPYEHAHVDAALVAQQAPASAGHRAGLGADQEALHALVDEDHEVDSAEGLGGDHAVGRAEGGADLLLPVGLGAVDHGFLNALLALTSANSV